MKRAQVAAVVRQRTVNVQAAQQQALIYWSWHCLQKKKSDVQSESSTQLFRFLME